MGEDISGGDKMPGLREDKDIAVFDEESLQAIREGRLLPMPEALVRSPEAYQAVIDYIRSKNKENKEKRMEMVAAVERYIKEIEKHQDDHAQMMSSLQRNLKEYGFRGALAGGVITTAVKGEMDSYAIAVFLCLYATFRMLLPASMKMQAQQDHAIAEELKRRLVEVMRPEEV